MGAPLIDKTFEGMMRQLGWRLTDVERRLGRTLTPIDGSGNVRGDDGHTYRIIGGVLRNTGSGFDWIADAGHVPVGFAPLVTTGVDSVTVNYTNTATRVVALVATPDDGFATLGYNFGASVGLSTAVIKAGISTGFADYVQWNGSDWVSSTGFITSTVMNATTGLITFNHANIGAPYAFGGNIALRTNGSNRHSEDSRGASSISAYVYPFNSATSLKAPTTDLRFFINRPGVRTVPMAELVQSGTNIWLFGLMEAS